MSYCRWSSENWKSDVYVYEHCDGSWTTHIAGNRVVGEVPEEPDILNSPLDEWVEAHKHVPITLPEAGTTIKDDSPSDCAETLRRLRAIGYHVPQYAIDELEAEAANPSGTEKGE